MFRSPKSPLPIAKSNLPEVGAEDATYCDGNDQRSTILYVPMQVFMSDNFDTAANNNSSITSVMKLNNDTTVIKKGEIHEFQESGDNKIWSDQPTLITKKSNDDTVVITIAKSNLPEVGTEDTTYCDGNDQRSTILYVPMQVFMSDNFDTAANNNSSITSVMKLHNDTTVLKKREIHEFQESSDNKIWSDQPTLITKKSNDDPVVIKKGEIHESQESSDNEIWSPLMDGIVDATGNCRKSGKDSEKVKAVKFLDAFIDRILYGPRDPSKRRLPVFEEICPE